MYCNVNCNSYCAALDPFAVISVNIVVPFLCFDMYASGACLSNFVKVNVAPEPKALPAPALDTNINEIMDRIKEADKNNIKIRHNCHYEGLMLQYRYVNECLNLSFVSLRSPER